MTKNEFISALRERLSGLPEDAIRRAVDYYDEGISDRVEDGASEQEAVAALGSFDEIVAQVLADTPLNSIVREKIVLMRKPSAWTVILIVLGFPLWFPLLAALFAVVAALWLVIWSLVLATYAMNLSIAVSALATLVVALLFFIDANPLALNLLGVGLLLAGLSIFMFFACKCITKATLWLSRKLLLGIKLCFIGKEKRK